MRADDLPPDLPLRIGELILRSHSVSMSSLSYVAGATGLLRPATTEGVRHLLTLQRGLLDARFPLLGAIARMGSNGGPGRARKRVGCAGNTQAAILGEAFGSPGMTSGHPSCQRLMPSGRRAEHSVSGSLRRYALSCPRSQGRTLSKNPFLSNPMVFPTITPPASSS